MGGSDDGLSNSASVLLLSLESETRAHPCQPKHLIGPDVNYGRELLAALAYRIGGWIGWEAASLGRVAADLAFVPLHAAHARVAGDIEIRVLVSRAFDRAISDHAVSDSFALLGHAIGFRTALRDSVLELRMGGVTPDALRAATVVGLPAREVAAVLRAYETLLGESGAVDPAGVFASAIEHFDEEARYCLDGELLIAPSLLARGLPGALLERLVAFGARMLEGDAAVGVMMPHASAAYRTRTESDAHTAARGSILAWAAATALPADGDGRPDSESVTVDMFAAATPTQELREVLRRVIAEGLRWDDVEIAAADTDTYAVALDVLCEQLGIGATMLAGIPLARTRLGRALERWFAWLGDGLPADLLRQALEAGELAAGLDVEPTALAHELRELHIGWGRVRYEAAVQQLAENVEAIRLRRRDGESNADYGARVASRQRSADGLRSLLAALLDATPQVPERGSEATVTLSVAQLASATMAWLALVPMDGSSESQTADRIRARLTALVELDGVAVPFGNALASLRDALSDVRAWSSHSGDGKPWSAKGGMLHLTDIEHAGTTGRRRVFVTGLSADATAGSGRQDPLIPDVVRVALAVGALSTTAERRDEHVFKLSAALASLRGRVTLSYATGGSSSGSEIGPAALLLQTQRLLEQDATLSYEQLRQRLGAPASAVPVRTATHVSLLDARDVWLDSVTDGPLLLDGESLVRECFPLLDGGLRARAIARSASLSPFTGLVVKAAGVMDPSARPERAISPSSMERLAACPLSWFYRYGLALRAPQDPVYDSEAWLGGDQRGALLHEVFAAFTMQFSEHHAEIDGAAADDAMAAIVDEVIARWVAQVPRPGDVVFTDEVAELKRAAASFLEMERQALRNGDDGKWRYFEYEFGGPAPGGDYALTDGTSLNITGRVDRVDELGDGSLRVIDYKSGRATIYRKASKAGLFNGGRRLQPAMYASIVSDLLHGTVTSFEYRFPTENGRNERVVYTSAELAQAPPIITQLLEHVRKGTFVPTTSASDCKYCEAREICRVERDRYGAVVSPRAEWAARNAEGMDAYAGMLLRRAREVES